VIAETLSRAHAGAKAGRVAEARLAIRQLEPFARYSDELRRALGMLHWLTGDAQASARFLPEGVAKIARASMDCVEDFFGGTDLQALVPKKDPPYGGSWYEVLKVRSKRLSELCR
jgi:hypothetical protein